MAPQMWRRRTTFVRQVLVVIDTVVSAGAFLAALFLREKLTAMADDPGPLGQFLFSLIARDGASCPRH